MISIGADSAAASTRRSRDGRTASADRAADEKARAATEPSRNERRLIIGIPPRWRPSLAAPSRFWLITSARSIIGIGYDGGRRHMVERCHKDVIIRLPHSTEQFN